MKKLVLYVIFLCFIVQKMMTIIIVWMLSLFRAYSTRAYHTISIANDKVKLNCFRV